MTSWCLIWLIWATADRSHRFRDLAQLHLALEGRSQKRFFILVAITLAVMILLIVWLLSLAYMGHGNAALVDELPQAVAIDVVGHDASPQTGDEVADDIYNYGKVLKEALDAVGSGDPVLRRVVRRCTATDRSDCARQNSKAGFTSGLRVATSSRIRGGT